MNALFFRSLSVPVLLALLAASARAAEVSSADAARAASAWVDRGYAMGRLAAGRTVAGVDEVEDPATGAQLRVVRFEGGGYVVLSADDLVDPVIAFSETGDGLVLDERNPFWALLRGDIAAREAAAGVERGGAGKGRARRAASIEPTGSQKKWADLLADESAKPRPRGAVAAPSDLRVDSFVDSRWNQSTHNNAPDGLPCYNYYTPNGYVTGCGATAFSQVMRHFAFPTAVVQARTYSCSVDGVATSLAMKGGVYSWSDMPPRPFEGTPTATQREAIGRLLYDVGVAMDMQYADGGSSSYMACGVAALKEDFGYACANLQFDGWSDPAVFKKCVIPSLDARSPVVLSIKGNSGGHMILADGYGYSGDDFCLHLNYGWGSDQNVYSDAWYCPPDLDAYTGSRTYYFDTIDGCAYGIFPDRRGSILSGRVLDASGNPVAGATVVLDNGDSMVTESDGVYAFVEDVSAATDFIVTASVAGGLSKSENATLSPSVSPTMSPATLSNGMTIRAYWRSENGTPGNSYGNDIVLDGLESAPAPVFDPGSCLFYPTTNVTITCSDPSVTIRYTTDGSAPTETNQLYSGAILVDDDVTIKARAFSPGKNPSPIVAETYTYDAAQGAPKGDYFADPIKISGMNGTRVIEDNSAYTIESGEPNHTGYWEYRTIWYLWTAPGSGTMSFQTTCSGGGYVYPVFVAVYTGDSIGSARQLGYDSDEDEDYVATLSLSVEQGTTYHIVGIMGYDGSGTFTLSWSGNLVVQKTPYETWAESNLSGGAPDGITDGVANAFRYVFGKPTGAFSPILSAAPGPSDGSVLRLSPVCNTNGVTLTVWSTTNLLDWTPPAAREQVIKVAPGGDTVQLSFGGPTRFFRLEAEVK